MYHLSPRLSRTIWRAAAAQTVAPALPCSFRLRQTIWRVATADGTPFEVGAWLLDCLVLSSTRNSLTSRVGPTGAEDDKRRACSRVA